MRLEQGEKHNRGAHDAQTEYRIEGKQREEERREGRHPISHAESPQAEVATNICDEEDECCVEGECLEWRQGKVEEQRARRDEREGRPRSVHKLRMRAGTRRLRLQDKGEQLAIERVMYVGGDTSSCEEIQRSNS